MIDLRQLRYFEVVAEEEEHVVPRRRALAHFPIALEPQIAATRGTPWA